MCRGFKWLILDAFAFPRGKFRDRPALTLGAWHKCNPRAYGVLDVV